MLVYLAIGSVFGKRLRVRTLIPVIAIGFTGLVVFDALAPTQEYIVRDTQSLSTLSDRLPLWEHLTKAVMREEPLTGMGYYAATRLLAPQLNWRLGNAHSAFFEFLVGGGLLGAAFYATLCASLIWYAGRLLIIASGRAEAISAVGLLAVTMIAALTSSDAVNAGPVGFTFWSMTAVLPALHAAAAQRRTFHDRGVGMRRLPARVQRSTRQASLVS
jgi:O-antigen ligase